MRRNLAIGVLLAGKPLFIALAARHIDRRVARPRNGAMNRAVRLRHKAFLPLPLRLCRILLRGRNAIRSRRNGHDLARARLRGRRARRARNNTNGREQGAIKRLMRIHPPMVADASSARQAKRNRQSTPIALVWPQASSQELPLPHSSSSLASQTNQNAIARHCPAHQTPHLPPQARRAAQSHRPDP